MVLMYVKVKRFRKIRRVEQKYPVEVRLSEKGNKDQVIRIRNLRVELGELKTGSN